MPNGNVGTFARAEYIDLSVETLRRDFGDSFPEVEMKRLYEQMKREVLYRSEFYQVAIDKNPTHGFHGMVVWHLSIKRNDKAPIMDWRDLQAIKNQLCGAECEAMQLFPAESRCVDSANQYHLFAFMKEGKHKSGRLPKIPIGWTHSFKLDEPIINGGQREFDPDFNGSDGIS